MHFVFMTVLRLYFLGTVFSASGAAFSEEGIGGPV
jgi:hypothetical protein